MREAIQRGSISFTVSAFVALVINLTIDIIGNLFTVNAFISMSPKFVALFPTPVIATYVNILLYGLIGAVFASMTFVFDQHKLGFVLQSILYFVVTALVWSVVVLVLWQLQNYPKALIGTLCGYAVSYFIIGCLQYRKVKADINMINEQLKE